MNIDPVRLLQIQKSTVSKTMQKFSNLSLDHDDLMSEAAVAAMLSLESFNKDKGYPFYSYVYSRSMNHLRNHITRKIVPHMSTKEKDELLLTNVYINNSILSCEKQVEAKDQLDILRSRMDDRGKDILKYLGQDLSHIKIAEIIGISRQAVDSRVKKMREMLVAEVS